MNTSNTNKPIPVKIALVYRLMYDFVAAVYTQSGEISHQLLGIADFDDQPHDIHGAQIDDKKDVPGVLAAMMHQFPMVVHIVEAWSHPAPGAPAGATKQDIVMITIHTETAAYTAMCPVDEKARRIDKVELKQISKIEGMTGRTFPDLH